MVAHDGSLASTPAVQVTVSVAAVNDAPTLDIPLAGSSFTLTATATYRVVLAPGALPTNVHLQVNDVDDATVDLTVGAPAPTAPAGVTPPATNPALAVGSLTPFGGNCAPATPGVYSYIFTLAAAVPQVYTVQVEIGDVAPQHAPAATTGTGVQLDPYTATVGLGGAPTTGLANLTDANTSQSLTGTLISTPGTLWSLALTGSGSSRVLTAQAVRTVTFADIGNHDFTYEVSDGTHTLTLYVRITVLNTGNVAPVAGLALGSVLSVVAPGRFGATLAPGATLAAVSLTLSDADGDVVDFTAVNVVPGAMTGVTPPAAAFAAGNLTIQWTGVADGSNSPLPAQWVYTVTFDDGVFPSQTAEVVLSIQDVAPQAAAGTDLNVPASGSGIALDPFVKTVRPGHSGGLRMALVSDANTGQTLALGAVNASPGASLLFDVALAGTGAGATLTITPRAKLNSGSNGIHDFVAEVSDGSNTTAVHLRIVVEKAPENGDEGCSTGSGRSPWLLLLLAVLLFVLCRPRRQARPSPSGP
ncbi:MAG: hypothetical protein DPW14_17540 [Planctomycetes bacterium]|nr:hypothetical protein [Planctomycetota bacterium]